jgi:hypothetical protein
MTSQEKAELLFNQKNERLTDGQSAKAAYEERARAEREKMARLKALRLAREANVSASQRRRPRKTTKNLEGGQAEP